MKKKIKNIIIGIIICDYLRITISQVVYFYYKKYYKKKEDDRNKRVKTIDDLINDMNKYLRSNPDLKIKDGKIQTSNKES